MKSRRADPFGQRLPLVGGLFRRLFLHHMVLVTVPIAVLGLLLVSIARRTILDTQYKDNAELANQAKGQINEFAAGIEEQLRIIALALEQLYLDPTLSDRFLNQTKSSEGTTPFRHLYAADTTAALVATTDFTRPNSLPPDGVEIWGMVMADEKTVSLPRLPRQDEPPTVLTAAPLRTPLGDLIGVLIAEVDVKAIWDVIDDIRVGERGSAFLTNEQGLVVAHPDRSIVYAGTNWSRLESVRQALLNRPGQVRSEVASPGGEPMSAVSLTLQNQLTGQSPWALVIHRPVAELEATVNTMRWQILAVVGAGMALALISTLIYTRRLIRPMGALVEGANRLSRGDLAQKIPVVGRDEMGTLATEFNLMVEQLSRIQERLRRVEHLDTLAKFSSVVAHEIRNPLNAMQINLHLLRERVGEEEQAYLNVISGEIRRLENLVREFQTISRPPVLSPEPTDVNALVSDIVHLQRETAERQGVRVHLRLAPELAPVAVDRNRVTQVFLNLILNALQAMPQGGELTLHTGRWEERGGGVVVQVSDTGEGIDRETLSRIFDYYFTTRDAGSGLGLSVAQRIVEEHGGRISIDSEKGRGTTVTVALPKEPPIPAGVGGNLTE